MDLLDALIVSGVLSWVYVAWQAYRLLRTARRRANDLLRRLRWAVACRSSPRWRTWHS